jgi:enamine deaminase RidA (YjgF/YER057c/UK114 family)
MFELLHPKSRHVPSGYTHGVVVAPGKRTLFVSGQLASNHLGAIESDDLPTQFATCLDNVIAVVQDAGAQAADIAKLTIYITDFPTYRRCKQAIAVGWHARFGDYYPAIAIVDVKELIDPKARVEIEAVAFL